MHQKYLQLLAIEVFTAKNGMDLKIISVLFCFVDKPCNLHYNNMLERKDTKTVYFGTKMLSSYAAKSWELIPECLKNETSLMVFKKMSRAVP